MNIGDTPMTRSGRKLISIVTPCYNEEGNILAHFERVQRAIAKFQDRYDFEHIYTDNDSKDLTFSVLSDLASRFSNVRVLRFSRNIGANRAMFLGLKEAQGDAVILIFADLQDPPEVIPAFIEEWENGYDVVYGQMTGREDNFVIKFLRRVYYSVVTLLADVPIPKSVTEFRLTSKRVNDALMTFREDDPYIRGAIAHIGYPQKAVPYHRAARHAGKSNFSFLKMVAYAINGFVVTTSAPIRATVLLGLLVAGIGFLFGAVIIWRKIFLPPEAPLGYTTLVSLITFFSGIQLIAIGVIGEYIRKIYVQSLQRERGFIRDRINL